eukprot:maker-scaffold29_size597861-snap-gene-3.9 protein:Tk04647 transcript:maker-scaffold29_size597861-snap-gene-3.9-mRNA-1 annotation:"g protein-activated inward rectifier potassium channel 3-like isoform x3"
MTDHEEQRVSNSSNEGATAGGPMRGSSAQSSVGGDSQVISTVKESPGKEHIALSEERDEMPEKHRVFHDPNIVTPARKKSDGTVLVDLPPKPSPFLRSTTTMSSVDSEMLEKQELTSGDEACDGFISQIDKDGNILQVPVKYEDRLMSPLDEDEEDTPNLMADFISADILTKPFNFVSGNVSKSRFNPFRKKSGLLNVLSKQSTRNRIVSKNGTLNTMSAAYGKRHHFLKDIFITMIDIGWGWIFVVFATVFILSWLLFAIVWYLTILQHGDFEEVNQTNASFVPCVDSIKDFTSCFLFSLETQHTIGYGGRATTEQCPFAIIIMCLQSIVGVIIQACMAGIIFAKFTVPRNRGETIMFSKNAVITLRNGALMILCRISDLRKASLLEAHVRMIVIRKEKTDEGEIIPYQQTDLECGSEVDGANDRVLMLWPVTVGHKIDVESPFYEMGPRDILNSQFEIVVTLEGVTEETGNTIQARTSYLPNEILWGHHFENSAVAYDKKNGIYSIQHNIINKTVVDLTPRCSSKQLTQRQVKRTSSAMTTASSSGELSPTAHNCRRDSSPRVSSSISGLGMEKEQLDIITHQLQSATLAAKAVVGMGDFNLDSHRIEDKSYSRRLLLPSLLAGVETAGLEYSNTLPTWRSDGQFAHGHYSSCLDHVYSVGVSAHVEVLEDATSDHRPILTRILGPRSQDTRNLLRRNFKSIRRQELEAALELWPWASVRDLVKVDEIHQFVVNGIIFALDVVAPINAIQVKNNSDLYLSSDTLDLMEICDRALP